MNKLTQTIDISKKNNVGIIGMTDEFFCTYVNKLFSSYDNDILILTPSLYEANKIFSSLQKYNDLTLLFPMDDFLTSESIAISPDFKSTRLDVLNILSQGGKHIVVCHIDSFLRFLPTKQLYIKKRISINLNDNCNRNNLISDLLQIGYKREAIVTNTGEIGIRGYVIDIFPINYDNPVRIEFFGDQIESIRIFDEKTQKSIKEIDKIHIFPNTEFLTDSENIEILSQKYLPTYCKKVVNILDYLNNPTIIIKDYNHLKVSYEKEQTDIFEYNISNDKEFKQKYMFNLNNFNLCDSIFYNTIDTIFENDSKLEVYNYYVKEAPKFNGNIELINEYIQKQLLHKKTILVYLDSFQTKTFLSYLTNEYVLTDEENICLEKLNIIIKEKNEGFIYKDFIVLTSVELFNLKKTIKYRSKFKYSSKIKSLSNLEIGDYVVHYINGIGIYNGLKTLTKSGLKKDYLEILYAGKDKLYIPVEKIELISKYTGKEGLVPKVNKLGSLDWEKTKLRVKNKVKDIAKKLIELYAKRELKEGIAFDKDDELQLLFENKFAYQETPDQLRAIEQIKSDMESSKPMDRLLCGDVGYGKTEVAFRAMFKAVLSSKQVLYLCPTTILSNQQYENAKERFFGFPVNIALLNRFTSTKETKRIISDLNVGKIDIVFGTHRLLSDDIKPKNLGLLVIDEEQRFGVAHKEKLKQYRENVDVLTLTATPIPRTLQMSLSGIKSLSLIETPPNDRYPIQTYVIEENKLIVRDAIYKEISRGGQVYILYNNVKKLEEKTKEIQQLVPEAKIVFAHGQMSKNELENKMLDFINREFDILVCTTIIETGIDINNVNTLIIYDADYFGLSQLYQIRGRVGRSNKIAYAYLMYKKNKILNDTAIKRLNAIKEFTELGSGFSIASRDLSIRGAGDILGSEQAGFIDSVGIDLYLKILNREVERLKGNDLEDETQYSQNLIEVETHISDEYVSETELKIEIHKLINQIDSKEKLYSIKEELEDRFGRLNESIVIYMYEEWFESIAKKLKISSVIQNELSIELTINSEILEKIDCEKLFILTLNISKNFQFKYLNNKLLIILKKSNLEKHYIYYLVDFLLAVEQSRI